MEAPTRCAVPGDDKTTPLQSLFSKRTWIVLSSPWMSLLAAGIMEISWAVGMKYSAGFTRVIPSVFTVINYIGSVVLLSRASRTLPLGTSYAVWTGFGILGTTILGWLLFHEEMSLSKILFLILLLISIFGLKLTSAE